MASRCVPLCLARSWPNTGASSHVCLCPVSGLIVGRARCSWDVERQEACANDQGASGSVHENRRQMFTTSGVTRVSPEIELVALRDIGDALGLSSDQKPAREKCLLDATGASGTALALAGAERGRNAFKDPDELLSRDLDREDRAGCLQGG